MFKFHILHKKKQSVTGKIVKGVQKAASFIQLDWVKNQCSEKLGFIPYPGTLNIKIEADSVNVVERLQRKSCKKLVSPDSSFCNAKIIPIIMGKENGALIIPAKNVRIHGNEIVEIISPVNLKETLKLDNGDLITVEINTL